MGVPLLHQGATVLCNHAGQVQPTVVNPRVSVSGMKVVTMGPPWTIAGCALPPPTAGNGPCVTAMFSSPAMRVKAGGMPILLQSSTATCVPTGTSVMVVQTQIRVKGQ